ncbi:hypothetical protein HOLleu_21419 [Holothuria leucospilota]|uniref:Uncharacterized protein n=1 Tax=Holothuria leucospilota TaxID=206669 RepID=A0A9Q1BXM5_HOLLE|nr:hypothetical protein HOLleu_21419 [Holothuria leucospilota]
MPSTKNTYSLLGEEPHWEKQSPSTCELTVKACLITRNEFCWVKCIIDGGVVEAKHLQVYTACKRISTVDKITKIEVGYYPDLDGAGKLLRLNRNWIVTEKRPFLFLKEGGAPLQILFIEIAPPVWKYCLPNDNPKVMKSIKLYFSSSVFRRHLGLSLT